MHSRRAYELVQKLVNLLSLLISACSPALTAPSRRSGRPLATKLRHLPWTAPGRSDKENWFEHVRFIRHAEPAPTCKVSYGVFSACY